MTKTQLLFGILPQLQGYNKLALHRKDELVTAISQGAIALCHARCYGFSCFSKEIISSYVLYIFKKQM